MLFLGILRYICPNSDPLFTNPAGLGNPNIAPSWEHPLGTDELGRDLWARLIYGARVILIYLPVSENIWLPGGTALWGVMTALVVGSLLGLYAGYKGGWTDEIIMRFLDAMMSIPVILLYLIIVTALGASAVNVVIAIMIAGVPGIARLVRGLTLDIRTREYIRAAETRGESASVHHVRRDFAKCPGAQ